MLTEAASLSKTEVGDIELRSHTTFVELPSEDAAAVLEALNHYDFGPVRLRARLITPEKLKVLLPVEVKSSKHKNASQERREAKSRRGEGRKNSGRNFSKDEKGKRAHSDSRRNGQRGLAERSHKSADSGNRRGQKKDSFNRGGRAQRRNRKY